ncbi:hypothetical protein BKA69DRAFT_1054208 [Paraphysoderma sedebokerense]|nr:hypothetical protein BKA69DRAFT_1054208 [Paraphysoderma sedebokerense]
MEIPQDSQFPSPPVSPQKRTEDINPRVVHTTIESFEESEEPGIVKAREKLSELYLQDTSGLQESYDSSSPRSRASSSVSSAAAYPPYITPVGTRSAQGIPAEGELGSSYYKIGGVQTGLEGRQGRDSGTIVGEPVLNVSYNADSELYDRRVPYIQGFSNGEEITEQQNLNLSGSLPTWLNGAFYRIGPGIFDIEYLSKRKNLRVFSFDHWYDGLSLVHRFEVNGKENQIKYRSRFTSNGVEATVCFCIPSP